MNNLELLLVGVALGAVPTSELGRLLLATLGQRLGVSPRDVQRWQAATDDSTDVDGDAGEE